jgi:hypothetical protein
MRVVGLLSLAMVVGFLAPQAPATPVAPVISRVTGTVAADQLLTLEGSNLHAEEKRGWDPWFTAVPTRWSFEGTHPFSGPGNDGYTKPGGDPGGEYDTTVKVLGNQSVKFRSTATNPSCFGAGIAPSSLILPNTLAGDVWLRVYARWNRRSNWPNAYMKMLYALTAGYYFQPAGADAGRNPVEANAQHDGTAHHVAVPGGEIRNGRWYAVELHWKTTPPYAYEAYWDGVRVYRAAPVNGYGATGAILFGIVNACGTDPWDVEHWMDGLALATTRIFPSAMVEVGNSPTYESSRRVVQPLETISDDVIRFRLDTRRLGRGPHYVWVRNNAQQLSAAWRLAEGASKAP